MKKINSLVFTLLCLTVCSVVLFYTGCKKSSDSSVADNEEVYRDKPDFIEVEISSRVEESLESVAFDFSSLIGDKKSDSEVTLKSDLLRQIAGRAEFLVNKSNHIYPKGSSDSEPAQSGLGYGAGFKSISNRETPTDGECNKGILFYYGLDCSGLVYDIFSYAGITSFPVGTASTQSQPSTILNALVNKSPDWQNYKVVNLGKLTTDKMRNGDIIYWINSEPRIFHIGLYFNNASQNGIVQSNGYWVDCKTDKATNQVTCGYCERNYKPDIYKVGPRVVNTDLAITDNSGFGNNYGIIRIIPIYILIESTIHHLGDGSGNEGTSFTKSFDVEDKDVYKSATFRITFSTWGPNSAYPPVITINGNALPSVLTPLPGFSNSCWSINGDSSYDYNCTYTYSCDVLPFLVNGSNTFNISNGRPDDDYFFGDINIGLETTL